MADGWMPTLAARLESGRHVLASFHSGAPASTPAFQAGLFYGVAPSLPGFVWFDRTTGREVRMDRPEDAARVERRLSRASPGLLRGGTSYFSIFSGGSSAPHFCLSGLAGDLALDPVRPAARRVGRRRVHARALRDRRPHRGPARPRRWATASSTGCAGRSPSGA